MPELPGENGKNVKLPSTPVLKTLKFEIEPHLWARVTVVEHWSESKKGISLQMEFIDMQIEEVFF